MAKANIGLLWRGARGAGVSARAEVMLGPLFSAFGELGVDACHVVYTDDAIAEVEAELLDLDAVLVWVNPVQDGATRAGLDVLLRKVAHAGVWVSAHPDIIDAMGTKEVLFTTRNLGWGTDTAIYRSPDELARAFPARLAQHRRLVVKQARGTGGKGVWRVELPRGWGGGAPGADASVLVQRSEPRDITPLEKASLGDFLEGCEACFSWSGSVIDQPYQQRLAEGMIRAYLVHDKVVGFCHQWPKGLLTPGDPSQAAAPAATPIMEDSGTPAYRALRAKLEDEWVPGMQQILGISTHRLPAIWDADFLYGSGDDAYVLCEINVQAVWPYPTQRSDQLAKAVLERVLAS